MSWKLFTAILVPVLLLPLLYLDEGEEIVERGVARQATKFKTLYIFVNMAAYWALELIPLPVTSLAPLVLLPLLGVQTAATVSQNYSKESNMIFFGGFIIALGVEHSGLHHRVALKVMSHFGSNPTLLLFGVMLFVAFMSMWISSTSSVALLVPVVVAIVEGIHESPEVISQQVRKMLSDRRFSAASAHFDIALETHSRKDSGTLPSPTITTIPEEPETPHSNSSPGGNKMRVNESVISLRNLLPQPHPTQMNINEDNENETDHIEDAQPQGGAGEFREELNKKVQEERSQIKKMFLFGMAYSANIGGTSVITGTLPNKVFKEIAKQFDISQGGKYRDMTFLRWMVLNVPPMMINIVIAWLYLSISFYAIRQRKSSIWRKEHPEAEADSNGNSQMEEQLQAWSSKELKSFLKREYDKMGPITFQEIAVLMILMLVIFLWILWGEHTAGDFLGDSTGCMIGVLLLFLIPKKPGKLFKGGAFFRKYEALLDWKIVTRETPWGVIFMLGSGFALADASLYSGLSDWLGKELELLYEIPRPVLLLLVICMTSIITEVVSNVACANILLPIVASVSKSLQIHPLYLTVAVAVTCQYAFVFPIATPSNLIVFTAGNFSTYEMVRTGIFLNVICSAILYINTVFYGNYLFNWDEYTYPNTTMPLHG